MILTLILRIIILLLSKVWNDNLARTLTWEYAGHTVFLEGIELLVFKLQAANLAPNALYYQHSRGLFNLSSLQSADVFISLPRFHAVDESAVSNVSIVDQADGRAFEWNIFVEPRSGITMGKDIALQINFESPGYGAFEDLQLVFMIFIFIIL